MSTITRTLGTLPAPAWHRPWFRYVDPVDGAGGNAPTDDDLGFPKDTKTDDMTLEEQAAYWKHQSKVQQKKFEAEEAKNRAAEKAAADASAAAAEQARLAALDDNQRAIETARSEATAAGKAEGIREGSGRHLGTAVKGMLIALTKNATESFDDAASRVDGAIEFADLTKFVGDDGELDAAKVQTFAQSIGSAGGDNTDAHWGDRFRRDHDNRIPPAPGSTGSVASMEQAAYDAMKPKTA